MTFLLLSAQILLAWQPSPDAIEYLVWSGPAGGDYTQAAFTTNTSITISNLTGQSYRIGLTAYSPDNASETVTMTVLIFTGHVQLAPSPQGPWTNYQSLTVPVELTEPARFVRVRLETE